MEDMLICSPETKKTGDPGSQFQFKRRIQFHPARKPYLGFSNDNPNFQLETLNPSCSRPPLNSTTPIPSSSVKKKPDIAELHGVDPELLSGITFRRIGAGLENLGNTCFLNSVLQCLTYTEPFAAYMQSGKHKSSCHTAGFCAMCAIQNHVRRALQSTGRILAPKDLVMNLRCISRNFRNARQEDAHEYMVNLLESMHKCCLPSGLPSESASAYEKSLVHKIFGGRLRSQVKCMQCSYCSNTFDPFLDLSLEITKADSLHKALTHFTAVEQLDGGERQYQCQRCRQKVKALKQLTVYKAPYVLSIHLKRFGSHALGQKINKKVDFGPTLNLKPFVSGSNEGDLKYTLYGVLVHAGWSTHSGHYYCYVRTSSGIWHSLDDNRVVQVSEKTVLQQKAYMLFYVRDRKDIGPGKQIDYKEIGPSVIGSKDFGASAKEVQNAPIATGVHTSDSSNKPQLGESSDVKLIDPVRAEGSSPLKILVKEHAVKQLTNGPSAKRMHPQSAPSPVVERNFTYPIIETSDTSTSPISLRQGCNPVAAPPSCSRSQSSGPKKLVINKHIQNDAFTNKEMLKDVDDLRYEIGASARLSNQPGHEKIKNEGEKAEDNDSSKKTRQTEPSIKSCKRNGCVQKGAFGDNHSLKKVLKPKKKVMKSRIPCMRISSRFLIKASLRSYKEKKQKQQRSKQRSLVPKNCNEKNFHEDSTFKGLEPLTPEKKKMTDLVSTNSKSLEKKSSLTSGDLEPSTSGEKMSDLVSTNPKRWQKKSGFKGDSTNNVTEGVLRERIYGNNAVLASNEPPQKFSSLRSEKNQWDPREPNTSQVKGGLFEVSLGSEEFTVARWDEIESSPSQNLGSKSGPCVSIGYVPDEWDEEYDRGKRKKVRNHKDSFTESNPFQEIATKKAKLKHKIGPRAPTSIRFGKKT